jgi:hypothetical protein
LVESGYEEMLPMEISEIKGKILTTIEQLSVEKLQMALELLEDLRQSEEDASQALLLEPGFLEDYREAKEDIRKAPAKPAWSRR